MIMPQNFLRLGECTMNDIIELKNEAITRELFDRAQFIFFAEGGAMGEGGAVEIVIDDGTAYHCNYVYGDADIDKLLEACPVINMPGELPKGWLPRYLGFGNHLFVRTEHYIKYLELLGDKVNRRAGEFQNWHDVAVRLCSPE